MNEVLVLLILVWAALFLPGAFRAHNTAPHVTVGGFERAMNVLRSDRNVGGKGRSLMVPADPARIVARPVDDTVAPAAGPVREDPVIARRRVWFLRSLLACVLAFGFALLVQGAAWLVFVATLAATAAYVIVLRRLKYQRDQARHVVRELAIDSDTLGDAGQVAVGGEGAWVGSGTVRLRRWEG
ncbi:MAG: hypothetical protein EA340_14955 [Nitriliruptor sp.]|nr:MAG: hypothetical protein EA340_14955 [Nitriliruptor sp.]TVR23472.1 MAG: hypothetical protein EA387_06895 [Nitriliruptor sp.]